MTEPPPPLRATAPGKLVLLGEYAVLEGAPAIVMAVERRAVVTAVPSARWTLSAPELGLAGVDLEAPGGEARKLSVVREVLRGVRAAGWAAPAMALQIDSSAFFAAGEKLGLGSSAAVAVALTACLAPAQTAERTPDREAIFRLALHAHRAAQGGAGSGVDVAASVFGGLLAYRRDQTPATLSWPGELALAIVAIGHSTSTADYVARVRALAQAQPRAYQARIQELAALATSGEKALTTCNIDVFLKTIGAYHEAMQRLGEAAGVEIVSAEHRRVAALVSAEGGMYKPSGAGGGDIGLLFGRDHEQLKRLTRRVIAAGFKVIPAPKASGMTVGF